MNCVPLYMKVRFGKRGVEMEFLHQILTSPCHLAPNISSHVALFYKIHLIYVAYVLQIGVRTKSSNCNKTLNFKIYSNFPILVETKLNDFISLVGLNSKNIILWLNFTSKVKNWPKFPMRVKHGLSIFSSFTDCCLSYKD